MKVFRVEVGVRFGHCDPGGIVYYPRYFEMINGVIEDWLMLGVGVSMPQLMYERKLLVPTVSFQVDFRAPSRFGDTLVFTLELAQLGRTSSTQLIRALCGREERLRSRQVIVWVDADTRRPVPIPQDLRARLAPFLSEETEAQPR
jgi:4-hydroxybenzoyl-CoA thioesterase